MVTAPLDGKGLKDRFNIFLCQKKITWQSINKNMQNKITNYYENIDFHGPNVVKKINSFSPLGILNYFADLRNNTINMRPPS